MCERICLALARIPISHATIMFMLHTRAIKCCAIGRLFVYRFRFTHSTIFFFWRLLCLVFVCVCFSNVLKFWWIHPIWNLPSFIGKHIASITLALEFFFFFSTHFCNRLLDFPAPNINTNSDEMYKKCFANGGNRQICLMSHRHL